MIVSSSSLTTLLGTENWSTWDLDTPRFWHELNERSVLKELNYCGKKINDTFFAAIFRARLVDLTYNLVFVRCSFSPQTNVPNVKHVTVKE